MIRTRETEKIYRCCARRSRKARDDVASLEARPRASGSSRGRIGTAFEHDRRMDHSAPQAEDSRDRSTHPTR